MSPRPSARRLRRSTVAVAGIIALSVAGVTLPLPARAEDDPESLIAQGVRLRRQGKDVAAQGYFRRAYEMAHTPRSAAQLGLVELAIADFWHAEVHFSEALSNPDAWVVAQRATLDSALTKGRKHLAALHVHGLPPAGTLEIALPAWKGPEPAKPDAEGVYWVPEGQLKVAASAPGFKPASTVLTTVAGSPSTWSANLEPIARPEPPKVTQTPVVPSAVPAREPTSVEPVRQEPAGAGSDEGQPWRYAGLAMAAVGAGAIVGGFVSRSVASTKLNHINSAGAAGGAFDDGDGNWRTYDGLGIGLIAGGAATLLGGAALYFFNRTAGDSEKTADAGRSWNVALGFGTQQALVVRGGF